MGLDLGYLNYVPVSLIRRYFGAEGLARRLVIHQLIPARIISFPETGMINWRAGIYLCVCFWIQVWIMTILKSRGYQCSVRRRSVSRRAWRPEPYTRNMVKYTIDKAPANKLLAGCALSVVIRVRVTNPMPTQSVQVQAGPRYVPVTTWDRHRICSHRINRVNRIVGAIPKQIVISCVEPEWISLEKSPKQGRVHSVAVIVMPIVERNSRPVNMKRLF